MRHLFFALIFGLFAIALTACGPSALCPTCTSVEQMKQDAQTIANAAKEGYQKINAPLQQKADELTAKANEKIDQVKQQAANTAKDISMAIDPGAIAEGNFNNGTVTLKVHVYNSKDAPVLYQFVTGDNYASPVNCTWTKEASDNDTVYTTTFTVADNVNNLFFGQSQFKNFAGVYLVNSDGKTFTNGFAPDSTNSGWTRMK